MQCVDWSIVSSGCLRNQETSINNPLDCESWYELIRNDTGLWRRKNATNLCRFVPGLLFAAERVLCRSGLALA